MGLLCHHLGCVSAVLAAIDLTDFRERVVPIEVTERVPYEFMLDGIVPYLILLSLDG